MEKELEISFHNVDHSPALEEAIRKKAAGLERFFERIIACRVVVEAEQRRQNKANYYAVHIDLHLPGREIVVNRSASKNHAHEDVYVVLRDAFNAAARQLEDHARKVRGDVKTHQPQTA
ncbi:MAG: ribosome-associated translation inhibitor RaiA [Kiloniellales bacterium]|nr:ribosome-associated translation inhibitor RaiA [Kiloniellales bacterium]